MNLDLDSEQKEVVNYPGSVTCIAGPGSGKTRTLVAKAESLFSSGADLICLTFTRAAAQEMRDRMPGIPAQTIHSFCHEWVGWTGGYNKLLTDFKESKWKPKYDWVLVDEAQDLTEEQLTVVFSITRDRIFAVGDPYQSIYQFNGSLGLEAITKLEAKGCRSYPLKNNYRSCPKVVALLNRVYPRSLVSMNVKENGLTAILARTNKLVLEASTVLTNSGVPHSVRYGTSELTGYKEESYGDDHLKVITCHGSKGLEFDYVILYKWTSWLGNEDERNLYYVSASRASKAFAEVQSAEQLLNTLKART